jgi:GNAT superfamily N-acetyltransferase
VLSELDDPALAELVADDLLRLTGELAGAHGPRAVVARFARRWTELTGATASVLMEQRIYAASTVTPPAGVPGAPRAVSAGGADRALVVEWLDAFNAEALPEGAPRVDSHEWLTRRLSDPDGELLLWEVDGTPVSLAGSGQATPTGLRVGPVYTPPEHRRCGYGAAVTAAVTSHALAAGRAFCFLFTDLANPTSNAIYQRIGYRPVSDVEQWAFSARGS